LKALIAGDDPVSHKLIEARLKQWGYEVVSARNGEEAWEAFQAQNEPIVAILDWMMPGTDGLEVCRRIRQSEPAQPVFIIFLTAKDQADDIVEGFDAGANDYLTKPFNVQELKARVKVAAQIISLQSQLADRITQLEAALDENHQLKGLLPICSYCKAIRNDDDYWEQMEVFISDRLETQFSHSVCPKCLDEVLKKEKASLAQTSTEVSSDPDDPMIG
jgi:CheY-like chemotaxis protein